MIALYAQGEEQVQVVEESRRWEEAELISPAQAAAVRERYRPQLVRVNLFIRTSWRSLLPLAWSLWWRSRPFSFM